MGAAYQRSAGGVGGLVAPVETGPGTGKRPRTTLRNIDLRNDSLVLLLRARATRLQDTMFVSYGDFGCEKRKAHLILKTIRDKRC